MLRKEPADRFFGWLSYSLSRSERIDDPDATDDWTLFGLDQTRNLIAVAGYQLGKGWTPACGSSSPAATRSPPSTGGSSSSPMGPTLELTVEEAFEGIVIVVVRDERGGMDWRELPLRVE
ncbi:MAG: hypothetical protein AAF211_16915 [Myxococcota bacterium]